MPDIPIVLASASPRRRELIGLIANIAEAIATDRDESFDPRDAPAQIVEMLSASKSVAGLADRPGFLVVGADTIVICDGLVLNKPREEQDARAMLERLSGRAHEVFTGVAVAGPDAGVIRTGHQRSIVRFRELTSADLDAYLATRVWTDKAGAYGIQGDGGVVVESVAGCYQSVVGFPLCLVGRLIQDAGGRTRYDTIPCGFRSSQDCPVWPRSDA